MLPFSMDLDSYLLKVNMIDYVINLSLIINSIILKIIRKNKILIYI
jgi:hypothetical protein